MLVSVQGLILVAEPYFNEPGLESTMHSQHARTASKCPPSPPPRSSLFFLSLILPPFLPPP